MGWEDRPYYRDRGRSVMSPLRWLLSGSVPLFTFMGIRVRAHASLLLTIGLTILITAGSNYPLASRAVSMAALFAVVVLHEFGHCFMARWLGGHADDILLWPLGGLAAADPPHRPLPVFLTVAAGPAVNALICVICAIAIRALSLTWVHLNPMYPYPPSNFYVHNLVFYLWWFYEVSYFMLLFNLLPIFPLDGGQMLQAILWPIVGHARSMVIAVTTGLFGSGAMALFGLISLNINFIILGGCLFYICYQQRLALRESAGDDWSDGSEFSESLFGRKEPGKPRRGNRRAIKRARKIARQEAAERHKIDAILAKVSANGMHSLNWFERRALRKATERQRRHSIEMSRYL
ncbi:MAG: site-2 protease family protein [Tepidisphaeraceae bacterium]|jgi:Zn-dependent protease